MKLEKLTREVGKIYQEMVDAEPMASRIGDSVSPKYRLSAKNLYRYLLLRRHDLRKFHDNLSDIGISAMRSNEGHVLSNLTNVLSNLHAVQGLAWEAQEGLDLVGYRKSKRLLRKNAKRLFSESRSRHRTEIMVTIPNEEAENTKFLGRLVDEGMQIARINLSHGDPVVWSRMVESIKHVAKARNSEVKIYMDLSGPKIRTSEIAVRNRKGKIKKSVRLSVGERIILTRAGREFTDLSEEPEVLLEPRKLPIRIGVKLPEILDDIAVDDNIFFDDGMIKAKVLSKNESPASSGRAAQVEIEITETYKSKLSSNKGINLPDTKLRLPSLTEADIRNLPFIARHADIVGYSFVRSPEDVAALYAELDRINCQGLGVVFKIETRDAFENLPLILLEGMKRDKIAVMIARGDLAVEIGFERISEVQQEIMWICEAGHIPVIWATQVLENLAKNGVATRAEVTDAAESASAECVMLNKGPHIVEAVRTLSNILDRMQSHSFKKKSSLRALSVAENSLAVLEKVESSEC